MQPSIASQETHGHGAYKSAVRRKRGVSGTTAGSRPVSVLLLHGENFWNLGDMAIFEAMVARLASELPADSTFHALSIFNLAIRPRETSLPVRVKESRFLLTYPFRGAKDPFASSLRVVLSLIMGWVHRAFGLRAYTGIQGILGDNLRAIQSCDVVISKGGNFLLDTGLGIPSYLLTLFQIYLATLFKKPVVLYSQSIGPFRRVISRLIIFEVLKNVRLILLREQDSLQYLHGLKGPAIKVTADETFTLQPASHEKIMDVLQDIGLSSSRPVVGMSVLNWNFPNSPARLRADLRERYFETIAKAAEYLMDTYDAEILFIPHVVGFWGPNDIDAINKVLRRIGRRDLCRVLPYSIPPRLVIGIISRCELFIGTRMHSNVFAAIAGVPVIAIGYLPKSRGIMSALSMRDFMIDIDRLDLGALVTKIDAVMAQRGELSRKISRRVKLLKKTASQNACEVRVLVESLVR